MDPRQVVPQVKQELAERLQAALEAGIGRERIVLDPGFGFGKAYDRNYSLLAGLAELSSLGHPLLVGFLASGSWAHFGPALSGCGCPGRGSGQCISGRRNGGHPCWCGCGKGAQCTFNPGSGPQ